MQCGISLFPIATSAPFTVWMTFAWQLCAELPHSAFLLEAKHLVATLCSWSLNHCLAGGVCHRWHTVSEGRVVYHCLIWLIIVPLADLYSNLSEVILSYMSLCVVVTMRKGILYWDKFSFCGSQQWIINGKHHFHVQSVCCALNMKRNDSSHSWKKENPAYCFRMITLL